MTRKDFVLIAATLKACNSEELNNAQHTQWVCTVHRFADALATTNANFDRARFLKACGIDC